MGVMLINKKFIRANKELRRIQKAHLKKYRKNRGRYPKAKLGKVIELKSEEVIEDAEELKTERSVSILTLTAKDVLDGIRKANVVGQSGSGFPTAKKIETVMMAKVREKHLVINAVACDPGLLQDAWILEHKKAEVQKGVALLKKCIPFQRVVIGSKENTPNRYPMGEEKILIHQLLQIQLSPEQVPAEQGILVLNIQTVLKIYETFYKKCTRKTKYITVANLNSGQGQVVRAYIGQPIAELLEMTTLGYEKTADVYAGTGVMDAEPTTSSNTIEETTNMVAFGPAATFDNEAKCKMCGACSRKCPMHIQVSKILHAIKENDTKHLEEYKIMDCIGCGTCSYYCKAGRNIMEMVQEQKERLR
ncbi:MAG: 4Fe-4S dicluster domain-containing protein [bacterium]|nr:4Fe-4S dicluster domain-containing protein [bacterium]